MNQRTEHRSVHSLVFLPKIMSFNKIATDHATQERQYKEHQLEGLDFELIDALRELACSEQADKDLKELWKRDFKMIKETEENGVDWYISEDF